MRAGLHDVSDDGFLAQLFARLQTMQPFQALLGAVGFTLVAAYQWAGRLGIFGEATTLARAIGKATFGKATSGTPYSPSSSG